MNYPFKLAETAQEHTDAVLKELGTQLTGLSRPESESRLRQYGMNVIAQEKRQSILMRLLGNFKNPLVLLLTALGILSWLTGDLRAAMVMGVMIVVSVFLQFLQEFRSSRTASQLKASEDVEQMDRLEVRAEVRAVDVDLGYTSDWIAPIGCQVEGNA